MFELIMLGSIAAAQPLPVHLAEAQPLPMHLAEAQKLPMHLAVGQEGDCRPRVVLSSNTVQPQRRPALPDQPNRRGPGQKTAPRPCAIPA